MDPTEPFCRNAASPGLRRPSHQAHSRALWSIAGAKNLAEATELQADYWRKQLDTLAAQAEEVRTLSAQVTADATKPMKRGMDELNKRR